MKKLFKSNNNLIITIVALVECILLIGISTFSWIEAASSLIIRGNDLPVADSLNYEFKTTTDNTDVIDLSTYFRDTSFFRYARASSADGRTFYFDKGVGSTTYRLGDTTDYNVNYYNIDFKLNTDLSKTSNYFFNTSDGSQEIFRVSGVDDAVATEIESAFRISITSTTIGSDNRPIAETAIYTQQEAAEDIEILAVSDTNATSTQRAIPILNTNYFYSTGNTGIENIGDYAVFSSTKSDKATDINIRIWLEDGALTPETRLAMQGAQVDIDLQFSNSSSSFKSFYFDDYTFRNFNTKEEYISNADGTTTTIKNSLYLYYSDAEITQVIPMVRIGENSDGVPHWGTANDSGVAKPRVSMDMIDALYDNTVQEEFYYFYGSYTKDDTNITTNEIYKWDVGEIQINSDEDYVYRGLTAFENGADNSFTYGVWSTEDISLYQFKDYTTSSTANAFNSGAYQFVKNGSLYLNVNGEYGPETVKMHYDDSTGMCQGYFKTTDDVYYSYTTDATYSSSTNYKVKWYATDNNTTNKGLVYNALGYSEDGVLGSTTYTGVGTFDDVEKITLSSELVDNNLNKNYRYKVKVGDNFIYMARGEDSLHHFAYVPVDSDVTFKMFNNTTLKFTSSKYVPSTNSNTFYLTDNSTALVGQWCIAVVVDATADRLLSAETIPGSTLKYSFSSSVGGYVITGDLIPLGDGYRYYIKDFNGDVDPNNYFITYTWTPYSENEDLGTVDTVFTYTHYLNNGNYFVITETNE